MAGQDETLEGYVVDIACLRKWPRAEWASRAARHSRRCSLEGHCLESGYALVDGAGRIALLDPEATLAVAEAVRRSPADAGIRLRVTRNAREGGSMATGDVAEIAREPDDAG